MEHGCCCYLHQQILLRLIFFLLLGFLCILLWDIENWTKLIHD
jgi:hypothetical protein